MIAIRAEVQDIIDGKQPRDRNVITMAPHPVRTLVEDEKTWSSARSYSRAQAVFPDPKLRANKFWPATSRIDDAYGDRNLVCECPSVEELAEQS
jgi:glycine dehydrogenase